MQDATLRRLTLVFILASAIAGFLALSYSSVWAHPAQQDAEETSASASNALVITPSTDTAHTFDGDIVTVVVDEGTVASGQRTLAYVPATLEEAMAEASDPPAGAVYGATVFRINLLGADGAEAAGERLAKPVSLVVKYSGGDIEAAKNSPVNLKILAFREGEGWGGLDTIVNIADGTLTTRVSRFSLFAVLAVNPPVPPPPATEPPPPVPPTVILPVVGDATLGTGGIMALVAAAVAFIATGAYFLRSRRKQES